jgi:hypothetical protein
MRHLLLFLCCTTTAWALDVERIPGHRLIATDGTQFVSETTVRFAVVGNTRDRHPMLDRGREGHGDVIRDVVADITAMALTQGLTFAVLTGDMVRSSSVAEWVALDKRFVGLLDGQTAAPRPISRIPVLAVAGDRDGSGDPTYKGLEAAFPGTGAAIGYGRVATWSAFDIRSNDGRWRVVVLDSGKDVLGTRWREQLAWIPGAVSGEYNGILLFVHDPVVNLAGKREGNAATAELLAAVDQATGMLAVKAVFFAGPAASQAILPEGHFGPLHVGTGGGGAPAQDLYRRGPNGSPHTLAPGLGQALLDRLQTWAAADPITDKMRDRARATGNFKGTDGVFEARLFPTYGWWQVELDGGRVRVTFRMRQPDGTFKNTWSAAHERTTGWVAK